MRLRLTREGLDQYRIIGKQVDHRGFAVRPACIALKSFSTVFRCCALTCIWTPLSLIKMAGYPPKLDRAELQRLRDAVKSVRAAPQHSLPLVGLVTLATSRPADLAITIDFEAARDLGHELIVVHMAPPSSPHEEDALSMLSTRERQIAGYIASGLKNKEIAARLSIAASTVKDHVHHILQKTGLRNRASIAAAFRAQPST